MFIKKCLKNNWFLFLLFIFITSIFFYKSIFNGYIPFPGDILIAEYSPWKYESFLGYNPGSYPNKAQYFDVIRQLYPWKTFAIDQMKLFQLPLWNPYNFSGTPLLANNQSAPFYPINIVFFVLPYAFSWAIFIFLQPLLSLFFTYLYLRLLSLSKTASVMGSVSFSFSLFMSVFLEYGNIGHSFLWLPLILYGIEKSFKKISWHSYLVPLGIAMSFLAGHLQISFYVFGFAVIYLLVRGLEQKKKEILRPIALFLIMLLGLGVSSIQLIPTFELLKYSARVPHDYISFIENLLIQPSQLILFISPDFFGNPAVRNYLLNDSYPGNALYIGFAGFILALYSLFLIKKNKIVLFFSLAAVFLLLLIVRWPLTEFLYKLNIPIISSSSPSNALFLIAFSLSVLSAFGFETLAKLKGFKKFGPLFFLLGIISLVWGVVFLLNLNISTKNFIYSSGLFGIIFIIFLAFYVFKKKIILYLPRTAMLRSLEGELILKREAKLPNAPTVRSWVRGLLLPILIFDLLFFFLRFNPFVPKEMVYPDTEIIQEIKRYSSIDRIYGYGAAHIEPNFETQLKVYSIEGYDPLYSKDYGEFIYSSFDGKIVKQFNQTSRSNAIVPPAFGEENFTSNSYRQRILNLLGVKYILNRTESNTLDSTFPSNTFEKIYDRNGWSIYENKEALPRYFLAGAYGTYSNDKEFEEKFFNNDFDLKTILLENGFNFNISKNASGSVELVSYKPNKVEFKTSTDGSMLLFLSDTYFSGWKAYVNGLEIDIYKANYAFRAVEVPPGQSSVIFEYNPESFYLGFKVSIISLIALIILTGYLRYGIYKKT